MHAAHYRLFERALTPLRTEVDRGRLARLEDGERIALSSLWARSYAVLEFWSFT